MRQRNLFDGSCWFALNLVKTRRAVLLSPGPRTLSSDPGAEARTRGESTRWGTHPFSRDGEIMTGIMVAVLLLICKNPASREVFAALAASVQDTVPGNTPRRSPGIQHRLMRAARPVITMPMEPAQGTKGSSGASEGNVPTALGLHVPSR